MLIGAVLAATSACRPTATFSVLRPAQVNVREHGGTVTVVPFAGPPQAAALVSQDLSSRIRGAEGGTVALAHTGGGLILQGTVLEYVYQEDTQRISAPCNQSALTSRYGPTTSCFEHRRRGVASVVIDFELIARATGQRVAGATLRDETAMETGSRGFHAPAIDGQALLERLARGLCARFSRVILPWRQEVRLRLGRCGDARSRCERGIEALREGDFDGAIEHFERAVRQLRRQRDRRARHLAEAYWNLGLAHEYSGDFRAAARAVRRARRLDPRNDDYRDELRTIGRMEAERDELIRQGL